METTIKIIEEKLKSLEWDLNYYTTKLDETARLRTELLLELAELKTSYPQEETLEEKP